MVYLHGRALSAEHIADQLQLPLGVVNNLLQQFEPLRARCLSGPTPPVPRALSPFDTAVALADRSDRPTFKQLVQSGESVQRDAAAVLYMRSLNPPARVNAEAVERCTHMLEIFVRIRSHRLGINAAGAQRIQDALAKLLQDKVIKVAPKLAAHTLLLNARLALWDLDSWFQSDNCDAIFSADDLLTAADGLKLPNLQWRSYIRKDLQRDPSVQRIVVSALLSALRANAIAGEPRTSFTKLDVQAGTTQVKPEFKADGKNLKAPSVATAPKTSEQPLLELLQFGARSFGGGFAGGKQPVVQVRKFVKQHGEPIGVADEQECVWTTATTKLLSEGVGGEGLRLSDLAHTLDLYPRVVRHVCSGC